MIELVNLARSSVVKRENMFCVALRDGSMPAGRAHPLGLYLHDTRYLCAHELRIAGVAPRLLSTSDAAGTDAVFEFTNPGLELGDGRELAAQSLRVRVERRMLADAMIDTLTVRSFAREDLELDIELLLDSDFHSMLELRGMVDMVQRDVRRSSDGDSLTFAAVGRDDVDRSLEVRCADATATDDGTLRTRLALAYREERTLDVSYVPGCCEEGDAPRRRPRVAKLRLQADMEAEAWLAERPLVEVDDEVVSRVLRRSQLDLRILASRWEGQRYFAAGIPWYAALFGRDSIITALQMLPYDRAFARDTLRVLCAQLGTRDDPNHDEEPGKALHELRRGELATAGLTPFARYYGAVDTTPLLLCLLCEHADWAGSLDLLHELRDEIEAALRWVDEHGDLDGDGLLEYRCRAPGGLVNQGWKDSHDGIVDEVGQPLQAPIALVEVQGYVIRAKRGLARLFELDGDPGRAARLREQADALSDALERFWLPELGFYSMALDGDKRASRALASNQGHLLWARAVSDRRAQAIARALTGQSAYSGWGVRTLSAAEPAFNPIGYHTGSVWPHDNALIACGLRAYGLDHPFMRLFGDLLDAASSFPAYRLPELFAGMRRRPFEGPVPYPVACSPQAWAAGSLPAMLAAGLGLIADGLGRTLRVRDPLLPRHVERLRINGLRVADARIDLVLERLSHEDPRATVVDASVQGDVDIVLDVGQRQAATRSSSKRNTTGAAGSSSHGSEGTVT